MNGGRAALHGLSIFERGWLSSNNVLVHGDGGGATLIDSGHTVHAEQTVALVRHAMAQAPAPDGQAEWLLQVINTHLHSDHCGGNAALQRAFGCACAVPRKLVQRGAGVGRRGAELSPHRPALRAFRRPRRTSPRGTRCYLGARAWAVLAAPGHDPDSVLLFDADHGVLISADALWENGFGVVFPELVGEPGFDDVARGAGPDRHACRCSG